MVWCVRCVPTVTTIEHPPSLLQSNKKIVEAWSRTDVGDPSQTNESTFESSIEPPVEFNSNLVVTLGYNVRVSTSVASGLLYIESVVAIHSLAQNPDDDLSKSLLRNAARPRKLCKPWDLSCLGPRDAGWAARALGPVGVVS